MSATKTGMNEVEAEVSEALSDGLKTCQRIISDYRAKLEEASLNGPNGSSSEGD